MDDQTHDETTTPAEGSGAGKADRESAEWTGGRKVETPEKGDPADLPELEVEEDSLVEPENS